MIKQGLILFPKPSSVTSSIISLLNNKVTDSGTDRSMIESLKYY